MSGDFVSGPTIGEWSWHWFVFWGTAQNIQLPPGGTITINNVPPNFPGSANNKITWPVHGEDIRIVNSKGDSIKASQLKAGDYQYPGDSRITGLGIMLQMPGYPYTDGTIARNIMLSINMDPVYFDPTDVVYIKVTSSKISFTGSNIPFHYYDWSKIYSIPYNQNGGDLGIINDHSFEIVIDR
jgi:hypothetical protein